MDQSGTKPKSCPSSKLARSKGESQLFAAVKLNYFAGIPQPQRIQTKNSCTTAQSNTSQSVRVYFLPLHGSVR